MGAGASALLPAECTKDDARAFAGERWNVTMDQRFDEICRDGKIAKEVVIQHEHSFGLEIRDWRRMWGQMAMVFVALYALLAISVMGVRAPEH